MQRDSDCKKTCIERIKKIAWVNTRFVTIKTINKSDIKSIRFASSEVLLPIFYELEKEKKRSEIFVVKLIP